MSSLSSEVSPRNTCLGVLVLEIMVLSEQVRVSGIGGGGRPRGSAPLEKRPECE